MARPKMSDSEKRERLAYQIALCKLSKKSLTGKTDGEIETILGINNKSLDGTVFRRLSSGKQIASGNLIADMLNTALSGTNPIFSGEDYYDLVSTLNDADDDSIINDHLDVFEERLDDVMRLTLEGSIKVRLRLIDKLQKSIKMMRKVVDD